jgi:sugar/nucleoside kinase (ribokinase family)
VPALCLGEALVDLVCERPVSDWDEADSFVPHFGGAVANVAVAAAGVGAEVALAGGAGEDPWGRWLRDRLRDAGVDLRWFRLLPGVATPVAFVLIDFDGEPRYQIYGQGIEAIVGSAGPRLPEAIADSQALFFSSNTLADEGQRRLTMLARERALATGRHVCFDPNLRLHRWPAIEPAVSACRQCLDGALLVRCNREEAELLTGEPDPERAARALVGAGARLAVVTLGPDGALLRGEVSADASPRPARVVSSMGAGDALMGTLLGRLGLGGWEPEAAAAALDEAVEAAARATERWGAVA